jgi:hypothetical protein
MLLRNGLHQVWIECFVETTVSSMLCVTVLHVSLHDCIAVLRTLVITSMYRITFCVLCSNDSHRFKHVEHDSSTSGGQEDIAVPVNESLDL